MFYLDKTLICCRTAWDNFEKIIDTLGGPMEKIRAVELKEQLVIYEDDYGGMIMYIQWKCQRSIYGNSI